jgi:hypothetical protein
MYLFAQAELDKLANEVGNQGGAVCALLGMFFVLALAMGIVLRTACSLFNALVGGKDAAEGIPMPSLVGCIVVVAIAFCVSLVLSYAVVWAAGSLAFSVNLPPAQAMYYASMASIPLAFLVLSIILALFLPAPIFRAFIISLLCLPVAVILFILFSLIIWVCFTAVGASFPAFQKWQGK